jgi:hypothetical protein
MKCGGVKLCLEMQAYVVSELSTLGSLGCCKASK